MTIATNPMIAQFLRHIPQSNQDAQALATLAPEDADTQTMALLYGVAVMLQMWGIVQIEAHGNLRETHLKATSQTAKYMLMSLAEYVEHGVTIVDDWKTRGIHDEQTLLHNGATLLHALESRRLQMMPDAKPARHERVAQVLITRRNPQTQQAELLFQYDDKALRYQLIGGRWRPDDGDDTLTTMIREIEEELPHNDLMYGETYQLRRVITGMVTPPTLSPTFGALTEYTFDIFHMSGIGQPLILGDDDQWVPIEQVLTGYVRQAGGEAVPFQQDRLYRQIDEQVGGLATLPSSFV